LTEKLTEKFLEFGGLLSLNLRADPNLNPCIERIRHPGTYFRKNPICIYYGFPQGLSTFLVPENYENLLKCLPLSNP